MFQKSIKALSLLVLASFDLLSFPWSVAYADPMKFHGKSPSLPAVVIGTAWDVFAEGEIDNGSDERLLAFLRENNVPKRSSIFLHSPGGNLIAGMKLGRAIRDWELFSHIGQDRNQKQYQTASPGECYSACALAYLGGVYRFYTEGSEYGVHRFYSLTETTNGSDLAQIVSATIIQYIRDMGTDPELFSFMSRAGSTELVRLTQAEMERLRVVNGGYPPTQWSLESISGALYLKGQRETWRGINKFILICDPKSRRVVLYIVFDPENRGKEVVERLNAHALMINDTLVPLTKYRMGRTTLVNGWINAYYILSDDLLDQIASARAVGIAMQPTFESPLFMGFSNMELDGGREKLSGLRNACRNAAQAR